MLPAIFGGDKNETIQLYLKAVKLIENKNDNNNNWNYLNLLTNNINVYMELEQYKTAKFYCEKTLLIEANFDWVKNKLYKQVLNQLKNE
jgi:tetratricopeptide (TPR) repeat protein